MTDLMVIKCPKCGSQAREEGISMMTLAYYQSIYDGNGININPDRNVTTTQWVCRNCGEKYETRNGVVNEITNNRV